MNFKPFGNRILAKIPEEKTQTQSGIFLPDTASKEKPTQAEVIAISATTENISIGDTVVYAKYAGTALTLDDVDYLVLDTENDILGVISK
jgi:chaperonin GroES